jgi:N-acetylglucosamine-6-phosphate deacetylase
VALVTDATAAAGVPPGRYELGGVDVVAMPGQAMPRRADGTIAGSSLRLDTAVRNVVEVGVEPAVALLAATRVPADLLGRTDLGRLAPGACADLVWWDDDLVPQRTWLGGVEVGASVGVSALTRSE